jgi:omega-6 fatty acid desaturase (delta-12 desaturase)
MHLNLGASNSSPKIAVPRWQDIVAKYQNPDLRRSLWNMANTFIPYFVGWYLMYRSLEISYWLTLALAVPVAGLLVRIFIILHDCGHSSYFTSAKANDWVGTLCGFLTFTPYLQWRRHHAIHHASSGDLDRRGVGDVLTLTVKEYLALPWWKRLGYRLYRNPFVMLVLGSLFIFVIAHRFVSSKSGRRERFNVHLTNLALLAMFLVLGWAIGFEAVLLVHVPLLVISCVAGVWMFYVQHQFEDTYWERHPEWQYALAALKGSSYYKLPRVLQWFTGNIGFHHIHHLSPKIPNYNLQKCMDENPVFHHVTVVTFWESLKTMSLKLWDEEQEKLVGFGYLKKLRARSGSAPTA